MCCDDKSYSWYHFCRNRYYFLPTHRNNSLYSTNVLKQRIEYFNRGILIFIYLYNIHTYILYLCVYVYIICRISSGTIRWNISDDSLDFINKYFYVFRSKYNIYSSYFIDAGVTVKIRKSTSVNWHPRKLNEKRLRLQKCIIKNK